MNKFIASVLLLISVQCQAAWQLNSDHSILSFMSTKNGDIMEVHEFDRFTASIDTQGKAKLDIDLSSVNTGIEVRDKRMRDLLFNTTEFSKATIIVDINNTYIDGLKIGQTQELDLDAELQLHGQTDTINTPVSVTRTAKDKLLVVNLLPVIIDADDYELLSGVAKLQEIAGLKSISGKVPVNFILSFTR